METKAYTYVDRSEWPAGPWDGEPDKVQWQDATTGYPCLARRSWRGTWCGYVGVSPGHPAYGQHYNDVDVEVHGGLTFADFCQEDGSEAERLCHVPAPGEPDHVYWLGFDMGHAWDYGPEDVIYARDHRERYSHPCRERQYRLLAYVQEECRQLAAQLAVMH